jgi:2-phosphosulfolactate phosphatase
MTFSQTNFEIKCEWGAQGLECLLPVSDVIVIVDVLSFSTCVDVAVSNGALLYPYRWRDESATTFAESIGGIVARSRRQGQGGYSLSPVSLQKIPSGTRLVLPSPNGSALSMSEGAIPTLAGCLRNARSVAMAAEQIGKRVGVIPAGEKWPDGSLRPAIEDLIGAGAIISHLSGRRSPEAQIAVAAFVCAQNHLLRTLQQGGSGREIIELGFGSDIELAAALNQSEYAPLLRDGAYTSYTPVT